MKHHRGSFLAAATLAAAVLFGAGAAAAHCDGLDGPVVAAARRALETGDVNVALAWVQEADERDVVPAFERARAVRGLGTRARELADLYFFETLVRVHRAGEGALYTGLKPAGRDLGPAIPAADRSIETSALGPLSHLITSAVDAGLAQRFRELLEARRHAGDDVKAGRRYVAQYVQFVHYVERLHRDAVGPVHGHEAEPETARTSAH